MSYIKIFQYAQALSVSVGNNYSKDQLMHIFLNNIHLCRKYSAKISIHQAKLRRKKHLLTKTSDLLHPYILTI